jgi:hypothetical protein
LAAGDFALTCAKRGKTVPHSTLIASNILNIGHALRALVDRHAILTSVLRRHRCDRRCEHEKVLDGISTGPGDGGSFAGIRPDGEPRPRDQAG